MSQSSSSSSSSSSFSLLLCVLSCCFLSLVLVPPVSVSGQINQLVVQLDRVSATSARIRFLNSQPSQQTHTLIQLTNNALHFSNLNRAQFHACAIFSPPPACPSGTVFTSEDREYNITQGTLPITSFDIRGLQQSSNYQVRVAYIDTANPPQVVGTAPAVVINTPALSALTTLNSLVASGGCGSLTSTGALYYLTSTLEAGVRVFTCNVVSDTPSVNISIIPSTAYSSIQSTPTSGLFNRTNQTLPVTATEVDPSTIYSYSIPLGLAGTTTNFSFIVTAESGTTQTYKLSIRRALPSPTSEIRGPSSPVTAMIRSPPVPSNYSYRALLWEGTTVNAQSWKVWSDDLIVFPFSAFNITFPSTAGGGGIDYTLAQVQVSPAASNPVDGSCSNINVGLFDSSSGRSSVTSTCVSALDDYCSATPFGAATKWQTFSGTNGQFDPTLTYHPAPPTSTFPAA